MAWSRSTSEEIKELSKEELLKKETTWWSSYNEPDTWKKVMKETHYKLIGEYEIDEHLILFRFELDESHRKDLATNASHFQNVIVDKSIPQVLLSETAMSLQGKSNV